MHLDMEHSAETRQSCFPAVSPSSHGYGNDLKAVRGRAVAPTLLFIHWQPGRLSRTPSLPRVASCGSGHPETNAQEAAYRKGLSFELGLQGHMSPVFYFNLNFLHQYFTSSIYLALDPQFSFNFQVEVDNVEPLLSGSLLACPWRQRDILVCRKAWRGSLWTSTLAAFVISARPITFCLLHSTNKLRAAFGGSDKNTTLSKSRGEFLHFFKSRGFKGPFLQPWHAHFVAGLSRLLGFLGLPVCLKT
jgi:hypothetical protein